jgi:cyclic pyranopterin phosphate synthase
MSKLSHINESGAATMVDVSSKTITKRRAVASAKVLMNSETIRIVREHKNPKGNIIETARLAGIMAAKQTANLIPLCHQIALSKIEVRAELTDAGIRLEAEAVTNAQTGVEMEALTAVSVAALTVYDMCKAVQKDMQITDIKLELKEGGKSDFPRPKENNSGQRTND